MAISTQGVTLKWGTSAASLTKVVDIKDFPDLGGAPKMLETTPLNDRTGKLQHTLGYRSRPFMYNSRKRLESEIPKIVKEVLG